MKTIQYRWFERIGRLVHSPKKKKELIDCLPKTSPTWKRFFLAQWLYVSVPLPDGSLHPLTSPTLYTAGIADAGDTEAASTMQIVAARTLAIGVCSRNLELADQTRNKIDGWTLKEALD